MNARGLLVRPMCNCGNKAVSSGLDKKGRKQFRTRCRTCIRKAQAQVKDYCEACNKKWEGGKRFDTDHIDGNPANNDPCNIQTLCRPCHVIKTRREKMFKKCRNCQTTKTKEDFWRCEANHDKLQIYCKECQKAKDKDYREFRKKNGPTVKKTEKKCNRCQQIKLISEFAIRRDVSDGRVSYCKPCWTTYVKLAQAKAKL